MSNFDLRGIPFFNPQVDDWKPELAVVEADHLANDAIILFPITSETYATGSLAETGFSILNAINLELRRDFVIMIDPKLVEENAALAKESIRARALVIQHIKKINLANLYVVADLDSMYKVSIILWDILDKRNNLDGLTINHADIG